jgi:hypothetical protein
MGSRVSQRVEVERVKRSLLRTATKVPLTRLASVLFLSLRLQNVGPLLGNSGARAFFVKFEVFTAVTMKNGVFGDVTPCGSCKNQRFGGT